MMNALPDNRFIAKTGESLSLDSLEIRSKRLLLRPISVLDAESIFKEFTSEITRYMFPASPREIRETFSFINRSIELRQRGEELVTVILAQDTEEFIGVCGLHARGRPHVPELGIWIKRGAHGNGFGGEAVRALYFWARKNLAVTGFVYPVDRANTASRKIPESLNGSIISEQKTPTQSGGMLDTLIYHIPV